MVSERYDVVIRPVMKGIELIDETDDQVLVRAGAGEVWDDFVNWCVNRHYAGVENLSHIPGSVGACPVQNVGAYGAEAKETIEMVETIEKVTGKSVTFNNMQCGFDYRDSFFKKNPGKYIITAVQFRLSKRFEPNLKYTALETELYCYTYNNIVNMRQAIINIRRRKLPELKELGNAGSFFKNPAIDIEKSDAIKQQYPQAPVFPVSHGIWKIPAAWLIQQCGWKGIREGNVGTHEQQPLVIVNYGGATGKEILNFARKIIESVNNKFGIELEMEVNII
jgi:UDP-N-acetylmuramate dehydrogenase